MKKIFKILTLSLILGLIGGQSYAGNKDRAGEAGAGELLINPWARTNGLGGANSAYVQGIEAQFWNVAGTAHTRSSELAFASTQWLGGTGTTISAFGLTQKMGENGGVLGLSVVSFNYGEIDITTVEQPEGGIGTFAPKHSNIGISYAKAFSRSIYGGINVKVVSESTASTKASTVAVDAGIQYVSGKRDQVKFGVALKNVGPNMVYSGDGLSFRGYVPGQPNAMTVEHRAASFELPSLIRIAFSYDFFLGDKSDLTPAYTFTSNSFTNDQHALGLEYRWSKFLVLRAGYVYESDINDESLKMTALSGFAAGISLEVPFKKGEDGGFSIDYAYQDSNPFSGSHTVGVRIHL